MSARGRDARAYTVAWWVVYVAACAGGLLLAAVARRNLFEPYLGVSLALLALLLTCWLVGPRQSLYAALFLTAVSDRVTVAWFPFVKNLSSPESIAYVADGLSASPLDAALALGALVSVGRQWARHRRLVAPSSVSRALLVFMAMVAYGFLNGLVRGASVRLALIESRPVWYIGLVFVVAVNELTTTAHARRAMWAIIAGVMVQSVLSIDFLRRLSPAERSALEDLNEHGSAIGHNLVLFALLAVVALGAGMAGHVSLLAIAAAPTAFVYAISQRRAGFGALVLAIALLAIVLYWHRRKVFWTLVPTTALLLAGYTAAFWNSTGAIGFGAQAVKSIVAPGSSSEADQASDLYRIIEAYDLNFTIRTSPIRGLGFGQPFYQPVALPPITDFELSSYLPHNSILWVWVKLGFVGFVAMFLLFGRALMSAGEWARSSARDSDLVVTVLAASVVIMYATFTWYDISWDARNTTFLGVALALCGRIRLDDAQRAQTASTLPATKAA